MEVHQHMETPGFTRDVAHQVILQDLVLCLAGNPALHILFVDCLGLGLIGRREVKRAQVSRLEFNGDGALLPLCFQKRRHDLRGVLRECAGKRGHANLLQVALAQHFFARDEDLAIWRLSRGGGVVQGKQESVIERYPAEARRGLPSSERNTVCQFGLDAKLV
jgi:hypothetical protein